MDRSFGAEVTFKLPKPELKQNAKTDPRAVPGLFLGSFRHPGGLASGEYLVVKLEDLSLDAIRGQKS